jgi:3-hydroxyisobutyrate dehydrogenase-like beta-hydroxyacid dehydrogenase
MESQGRIGEKDLALAIALADSVGVPLPTAVHAKAHVLEAMTGRLTG